MSESVCSRIEAKMSRFERLVYLLLDNCSEIITTPFASKGISWYCNIDQKVLYPLIVNSTISNRMHLIPDSDLIGRCPEIKKNFSNSNKEKDCQRKGVLSTYVREVFLRAKPYVHTTVRFDLE